MKLTTCYYTVAIVEKDAGAYKNPRGQARTMAKQLVIDSDGEGAQYEEWLKDSSEWRNLPAEHALAIYRGTDVHGDPQIFQSVYNGMIVLAIPYKVIGERAAIDDMLKSHEDNRIESVHIGVAPTYVTDLRLRYVRI